MPGVSDSEASQSFVPLSLLDTISSKRTYTSRAAAVASSSRPRPSHAHQASLSVTSKELARQQAAQLCASLGIEENFVDPAATPKAVRVPPGGTGGEGEPLPPELARLRLALGDKENEINGLRRQLALLTRENGELTRRNERLEKEQSAGGGLGARQLEEVEKSFAAQEALLAGFQKEAERSSVTIESLRSQQRRVATFLEKLYGPAWESELSAHLDRPGSALPLPSLGGSSPRGKGPRPSLLTTPSHLSRGSKESSDSDISSVDRIESPSAIHAGGVHQTADAQEALRAHMESIQSLLRGMERRLISRDVELEAMERRAKDENERAEQRVLEVEQLMSSSSSHATAVSDAV